MRETIWKDLLFSRRDLLVNLVIITVTLALLSSLDDMSARAVGFFAGLMAAVFPITLVTREDKSNALALSCSLPVTRRTVVRARYVFGIALAVGGVLLALSVAALLPASSLTAAALFGGGPLLLALSLALLFMGLMLPFALRYGAMGLIGLMVALQVVGVVLLVVTQITGSNADVRLIDGVVGGVRSLRETLGGLGFTALLWAALAVFMAGSYQLAVFVFERREL